MTENRTLDLVSRTTLAALARVFSMGREAWRGQMQTTGDTSEELEPMRTDYFRTQVPKGRKQRLW